MKNPACLFGLFFTVCAALASASPAQAGEKSYQTEVINSISIGDISIALREYEKGEGGEEKPFHNFKNVIPGETLNLTACITNMANPAWVRVKLTYTPADGMKDFPSSCINLACEHWIERGGYYYHTKPLGSGDDVDIFSGIIIPPFWGNEAAGSRFELLISAQAVQAANFTPDFSSDEPWFGTLIETCVHTAHNASYMTAFYKDFSVSFEGGAEGLVHIGDDFFGNFGTLMPGDEGNGTLSLKNGYSKPVALYFRTEGLDDGPLAKEAQLTIRDGENVIYDGKLSGSRGEVLIATLNKGDEKELTYSIFIPPECGNSYALTKAADKWIFRAAINVPSDTAAHTSSGGHSHSGGGGRSVSAVALGGEPGPGAEFFPYTGNLALTGEGLRMAMACFLLAASGLILAVILRKRGD